ncbi:MAG: LacI family DNA-binding transcriptional regulator [Acidimicrobiales bacterium]|nr:LacI family DNA-binding transcriptional regulator [Acidimicrobiales bacterium]
MQRLNLEEIGRLAGVSRSTVSRVVNGETNVSEDAKKRVQAVIDETGYRPHAAARSLASNRTGVIGLVIPSAAATLFDDPYFGRLILGATSASNSIETTLALFLFEEEADQDSLTAKIVGSGLVDGVIVTAAEIGESITDHLRRARLPFVVVGRPDDSQTAFSVDADNRSGAHMAAAHLHQLGRTRPALIAPPSNTTAGIDRRSGFLEGLAEAGLDIGDRTAEGNWTEASGQTAMESLLPHQPDSVFAGSDRMAVGAMRAIREAGLACPRDIAVVSFDGLIPADQTSPRLTSVAQPVAEVGRQAVMLLKAVIDNPAMAPQRIVLPPTLLVRESCGTEATSP